MRAGINNQLYGLLNKHFFVCMVVPGAVCDFLADMILFTINGNEACALLRYWC